MRKVAFLIALVVVLLLSPSALPGSFKTGNAQQTSLEVLNPLTGDKWLNFTTYTHSVGDMFVLNITASDVADLNSWHIRLTWDPNLLEFVSASLPADHVFSGAEAAGRTLLVAGPSAGSGYVDYSVIVLPEPFPFSGTGTVCQIALRIIHGVSQMVPHVACSLAFDLGPVITGLFDSVGNPIPFMPLDGYYDYLFGGALPADEAIVSVDLSNTAVARNSPLRFNVTVTNYGEASYPFNVTVYVNSTTTWSQRIDYLFLLQHVTLTFTWDTTGYALGVYNITAAADEVPGDPNTANNVLTAEPVHLIYPGDVNGDGVVSVRDILLQILAFNSHRGSPAWNPYVDMDASGKVDVRDIVLSILHFNERY